MASWVGDIKLVENRLSVHHPPENKRSYSHGFLATIAIRRNSEGIKRVGRTSGSAVGACEETARRAHGPIALECMQDGRHGGLLGIPRTIW